MKPTSQSIIRAILYGGASTLLLLDIFFLIKAALQDQFVSIVPIIAGVFITAGLIFIIYAERKNRLQDKEEHRRLSRVAHQLENPLQILEEDLSYLSSNSSRLPAEEKLKLKRMNTKAKVLLENVRDVFLMLEAQSGQLRIKEGAYDLCTLLREALEKIKPLASARNVEVVLKAHCDTAVVKVDRHLFLIAVTHLLENAITYTLTPGLVNVAIIKGNKSVRIVIQDRGVGIRLQDTETIFLPFARGEKADQFDPDGIGVGLTLARLIATHLGGKLRWEQREHTAGTQFEMTFPLVLKG